MHVGHGFIFIAYWCYIHLNMMNKVETSVWINIYRLLHNEFSINSLVSINIALHSDLFGV